MIKVIIIIKMKSLYCVQNLGRTICSIWNNLFSTIEDKCKKRKDKINGIRGVTKCRDES